MATWGSSVYSHYDVSLLRCLDEATQTPLSMSFKFTCKTHPENHIGPQFRQHTRTGQGTSNLQKDVDQCLKKQGLDSVQNLSLQFHTLRLIIVRLLLFAVLRVLVQSIWLWMRIIWLRLRCSVQELLLPVQIQFNEILYTFILWSQFLL